MRRKFFFSKYLPDPDAVRATRLGRMFGGWLDHPSLWHLSRRSVPGAVAIGLFCGLIPGPLQMGGALVLVLLFRKNIPVALVTTLYTNPFTIVPLYVLAYAYGAALLGIPYIEPKISSLDWETIAGLGRPLGLGLLALALTLAAVGHVATVLGWRFYVILRWKRRQKR